MSDHTTEQRQDLAIYDAIVRAAQAKALRDAASDPDARLGGHSGVSVRWLRRRADEIEAS